MCAFEAIFLFHISLILMMLWNHFRPLPFTCFRYLILFNLYNFLSKFNMNATLRILSAHPSSVILKPVQTGFVDVNKLMFKWKSFTFLLFIWPGQRNSKWKLNAGHRRHSSGISTRPLSRSHRSAATRNFFKNEI